MNCPKKNTLDGSKIFDLLVREKNRRNEEIDKEIRKLQKEEDVLKKFLDLPIEFRKKNLEDVPNELSHEECIKKAKELTKKFLRRKQ